MKQSPSFPRRRIRSQPRTDLLNRLLSVAPAPVFSLGQRYQPSCLVHTPVSVLTPRHLASSMIDPAVSCDAQRRRGLDLYRRPPSTEVEGKKKPSELAQSIELS